jgi:hypothetical protein
MKPRQVEAGPERTDTNRLATVELGGVDGI